MGEVFDVHYRAWSKKILRSYETLLENVEYVEFDATQRAVIDNASRKLQTVGLSGVEKQHRYRERHPLLNRLGGQLSNNVRDATKAAYRLTTSYESSAHLAKKFEALHFNCYYILVWKRFLTLFLIAQQYLHSRLTVLSYIFYGWSEHKHGSFQTH